MGCFVFLCPFLLCQGIDRYVNAWNTGLPFVALTENVKSKSVAEFAPCIKLHQSKKQKVVARRIHSGH